MEMIAPLAKVLAEANGIDWRVIRGTGAGGEVVEQDILQYLTRIMTGEEEPPATPVDAPPPDWTGEMPSMELLAAAGMENDAAELAAIARSEGSRSASVPTVPAPELAHDATDFELEFDDEDTHDHPAVTRDPDDMAETPRDADYAGNDFVEAPAVHTPDLGSPLDIGPTIPTISPAVDSPAPAYIDPAQDAPPHGPQDTGVPATDDVPAGPRDGGWHDAQSQQAYTQQAQTQSAQSPATQSPTNQGRDELELDFDEPAPPAAPAPFSLTGNLLGSLYGNAPEPTPPAPAPTPAEPAFVAPVPPAPVTPAPAPVATPEPVSAPQPALTAQAATEQAAPARQERRRSTLRFAFGASALEAASNDLAEHFGASAPLSIFVARAASRRMGDLGLSSVGIYSVAEDATPVAIADVTGDFRAAVSDLQAAREGEVQDLMVVDAGELGLDELQLPGSATVLSLGRIRDGSATLTLHLSSAVGMRTGAAFLQAVAELLETPIRLML